MSRDGADIRAIDLPVFSLGTLPTGPLSVSTRSSDALVSAAVGEWTVTVDDVVFGDEDGALFVSATNLDVVLGLAEAIRDTERAQAAKIAAGDTLRDQVRFTDYLAVRAVNPDYTFRDHLKAVGGAVEV